MSIRGWTCTVLGDGKLGILVAQVLQLTGARVLAVGRHPNKLAILAERGIATVLADAWTMKKVDLCVESTGTAAGFEKAMLATRPRGMFVLKSTVAERLSTDLAPLVIHEIQVVGSRCGSFAPALRALASSVDVKPLIAARVPLCDAVRGLELAGQRGMLKVLVDTA